MSERLKSARKFIAPVLASAVLGLSLGSLNGIGIEASQIPEIQENTLSGYKDYPSKCTFSYETKIEPGILRMCETYTTTVEFRQTCDKLPIHVIYALPRKSWYLNWLQAQAPATIQTLEAITDRQVEYGLVMYDETGAETVSDLVTDTIKLKNELSKVERSYLKAAQPHIDIYKRAVEILRAGRRDVADLSDAIEIVIHFEENRAGYGITFPPEQACPPVYGSGLTSAEQETINFLQGCMDGCCDQPNHHFEFPLEGRAPNGSLNSRLNWIIDTHTYEDHISGIEFEQELPIQLKMLEGSAKPELSYSVWRTQNLYEYYWDLRNFQNNLTITYQIDPTDAGAYEVKGRFWKDSNFGLDPAKKVEMPSLSLDILDCPGFIPTPTPTPTPYPTREPVTRSPYPSQPYRTPYPSQTPTPLVCENPLPIVTPETVNKCSSADVSLVLDISSSMAETGINGRLKIEDALDTTRQFIGELLPRDSASLVTFNEQASLLHELTSDKNEILPLLSADLIKPAGGTKLDLGIREGHRELISGRRRAQSPAYLVLLTDGNSPLRSSLCALNEAGRAEENGVDILSIGFGFPESTVNSDLLAQIAGGSKDYYYAPGGAELEDIYNRIQNRIACIPPANTATSTSTEIPNTATRTSMSTQTATTSPNPHNKSAYLPIVLIRYLIR